MQGCEFALSYILRRNCRVANLLLCIYCREIAGLRICSFVYIEEKLRGREFALSLKISFLKSDIERFALVAL